MTGFQRPSAVARPVASSPAAVSALLEGAPRAALARTLHGALRQMEPVALLTPRWSAPQTFLEELALDLAVGEPEVGCRTVSFRPLMGRSEPEAWNFLLRVLGDLSGARSVGAAPMVVDRRGFECAAALLLDAAQEGAEYAVALLAHGAEHLPVAVLDDFARAWAAYRERCAKERRCTLLLAGSVDSPALDAACPLRLELPDYGSDEAAESLRDALEGSDADDVERLVQLSGGLPALLHALGQRAAPGAELPDSAAAALAAAGPLGAELRGAVQHALAAPEVAERLLELSDGTEHPELPEPDTTLVRSGLARRRIGVSGPRVALRSACIAAALG